MSREEREETRGISRSGWSGKGWRQVDKKEAYQWGEKVLEKSVIKMAV